MHPRHQYLSEISGKSERREQVERFLNSGSAEEFLRQEIGLRQFRVRHHDPVARLEVPPEEWDRVLDSAARERIITRLRELGYLFVALDLAGFRSGSLNDALERR